MYIQESEVDITAIRAQGAGGQNVNKVSSAIHLRFDVKASSLPEDVKARLLALSDHRITQDMNRMEAFARLHELVQSVAKPPKKRKPTKPTYASQQRRLESKKKASAIKSNRGRVI
jgi:ribosome-associated protein